MYKLQSASSICIAAPCSTRCSWHILTFHYSDHFLKGCALCDIFSYSMFLLFQITQTLLQKAWSGYLYAHAKHPPPARIPCTNMSPTVNVDQCRSILPYASIQLAEESTRDCHQKKVDSRRKGITNTLHRVALARPRNRPLSNSTPEKLLRGSLWPAHF